MLLVISKIVCLDPNFIYPSDRNCPTQEWIIEKHQRPHKLSGTYRVNFFATEGICDAQEK
jgi:hypothetical protein